MYKLDSDIHVKALEGVTPTGLSVEGDFTQSSFCMALVGPPGAGKTTLVYNLLSHPKLYYKKFDAVFFLTPSSIPGLALETGVNHWPALKVSWLVERIEEVGERAKEEKSEREMNILIVIDDLISDLNKASFDDAVTRLFYNRRHYAPLTHLHFIITTQKWTMIPARLRATITMLCIFNVSMTEWRTVTREIRIENVKGVEKLMPLIFGKKGAFIAFNINNNMIFHNFDRILI